MDVESLLSHCLAKPGAEETYPWGDAEMVAKVGGKGFAFVGLGGAGSLTVKATPDDGEMWRQRYPDAIRASAYVGRFGWISMPLDGTVPDAEVVELVDESYLLIAGRLPRSKRPEGWDG